MSVRTGDSIWVPTVSARLYRPIALALEARGIAADALFAEFGMPSPASAGWDVRMPLPQIANIWSRLLEATGDSHFPFRAAEHVDLTTCDVITYLESAASTLRGALEKKLKYLPLITDAIEWTLDETGDSAALALHERPARPPLAPVAEFLIGARHVFLERFGPPGYRLQAVSFRHAAPADPAEYARIFGVQPSFAAKLDQLTFARRHLDEPMRRRDDALSDILGRYAEQMTPPLRDRETWRGRVLEHLQSGIDPGIAAIARALGVSPRTLQRALAEENTSYLDVATSARRAAAEQLLRRRELGISEVAFALGFSGSPAFHRAFRRWTGTTPNEFRARELGGAFSEPLVSALHEVRRVN
ncbi:MAG TPA: AraC family transcriptional regulator [Polyangiaceae bacterium]|nr:AraC family transcriptional regulator [Polyangiaceae bacterium]